MALPTKLHGFHPTQPISVPGTQQDTLKGPVHHMAEHHEGQEGLMSRLDQQEEWDVSVTRIGISQEKNGLKRHRLDFTVRKHWDFAINNGA